MMFRTAEYHAVSSDDESTVFVWKNIKIKPGTKNKICAKAYFSDGTSRTDYSFWTGK